MEKILKPLDIWLMKIIIVIFIKLNNTLKIWRKGYKKKVGIQGDLRRT